MHDKRLFVLFQTVVLLSLSLVAFSAGPAIASGAPSLVSYVFTEAGSAVSSLSWSMNVPLPAVTNSILLVAVGVKASCTSDHSSGITSVTWDGMGLTLLRTEYSNGNCNGAGTEGSNWLSVWYLLGPIPDQPGNVVATFHSSDPGPPVNRVQLPRVVSLYFTNVNIVTPFDSSVGTHTLIDDVCDGGKKDVEATNTATVAPDYLIDFMDTLAYLIPGGSDCGNFNYPGTIPYTGQTKLSDIESGAGFLGVSSKTASINIPYKTGWRQVDTGGSVTYIAVALAGTGPFGGGGGTGNGVGGALPLQLDQIECQGSNTVKVTDTRPEAANAVLWIWDWGDNTTDTTSTPTGIHAYHGSGTYTVVLSVQDTNGGITTFAGPATPGSFGCQLMYFANLLGPWILSVLILSVFALVVTKTSGKSPKHPLFVNVLLVVAVGAAIVVAVFLFIGWSPTLPGGFAL